MHEDLRPKHLPLFLTAADVAGVLGVDERTAQRWIRNGKFGAFTELGRLRVRRDQFWASMLGTTPRRRTR